MNHRANPSPPLILRRLIQAWNAHDLAALVASLHKEYESIHPLHPERNRWGREIATEGWSALFAAVPDLRAELLRWAQMEDTVWAEWRWRGSHVSGAHFEAGGVMIFGVVGEQIRWTRVYTETNQALGPDWDAVLEEILREAD